MASLKSTHWCKLPFIIPQVELATLISRGKELWSCPSLLSMTSIYGLMSVPLMSYTGIDLLYHHNPPLGTFHPWSCMDVLANVHGRACIFLLIHPIGVLLAWCRVGARQSAHCGNSAILLPSGVGLSRMELVHLVAVVHTLVHCVMPLSISGVMRSQLHWRIWDQPCSSFMRYEGTSFVTWCSTSYGLSSFWSLIFLFPWYESAFTETRLPGSTEMALVHLL